MALKFKCKWCSVGANQPVCFNCREKFKILTDSGLFGGKAKRKPKKTKWEQTDAYAHEMGSGTKELVEFVNKIGTIHYGRVVARERMG